MKGVSVSNLAWGGPVDLARCEWLAALGVRGLEIAPTALAGGAWPTESDIRATASDLQASGLRASGLQSLLFGRPDLALFDRATWPDLTAQLTLCAQLAERLRADVLVFGSPRNRLRGDLTPSDSLAMAAEYFSEVAGVMCDHGVVLTLEPNPPGYGADFMSTYAEVLAVADRVGSPWVLPQVDTGCLSMAGDDPSSAVLTRAPAHVHVSAVGLGALPGDSIDHASVAAALHEVGYARWVTVEILGANLMPAQNLEDSIRWAVQTYG